MNTLWSEKNPLNQLMIKNWPYHADSLMPYAVASVARNLNENDMIKFSQHK